MNWFNLPFSEWSPYLFILLAGAIPTQIWRSLGIILSRSMDENGEILKWVRAVATALVAGLIAKLVIFPTGDGRIIIRSQRQSSRRLLQGLDDQPHCHREPASLAPYIEASNENACERLLARLPLHCFAEGSRHLHQVLS